LGWERTFLAMRSETTIPTKLEVRTMDRKLLIANKFIFVNKRTRIFEL
jgi:hypothetical protein